MGLGVKFGLTYSNRQYTDLLTETASVSLRWDKIHSAECIYGVTFQYVITQDSDYIL